MVLRYFALLVLLISFAFPAQAKISMVEPCPSQTSLMSCTFDSVVHSSNSRLNVESSCGLKCISLQSLHDGFDVSAFDQIGFYSSFHAMVGLIGEGIDRPPKDC